MSKSQNNNQQRVPIGEMMGNSLSHPPTQQPIRPSMPTANNGIGTTSIAPAPAPQPSGPIPGSVGAGQISSPPAPQSSPGESTRGLGSNNIAPAPAQQRNGGQK